MLTTINPAALTDGDGMTIYCATGGELCGLSISGAGDVNGDGLDDSLINAPTGVGPMVSTSLTAGVSSVVPGAVSLPATIGLLPH